MHSVSLLSTAFCLLLSPCSSSLFGFVNLLSPFSHCFSLFYIHFLFACFTTRNSHISPFQLSLSLPLHYLAFYSYSQIFKINFYSSFTSGCSTDFSPLLLSTPTHPPFFSRCLSQYSCNLARLI